MLANSLIAAVLGSVVMVLAHEIVHLIAGMALGYPSTLYSFGVTHNGSPTPADEAIMAASAPIFSLITGIACALWQPLKRRGGFSHLLWLWFAFVSIMEGVCYLVITPFGAGDTATVAKALNWPVSIQLLLCALGIAGMFGTAKAFSPSIPHLAGADRNRQWALALWPWLLGTLVLTALSILMTALASMEITAGEQFAIIMAASATLCFAPMGFIFNKSWQGLSQLTIVDQRWPISGAVCLIALTAFNVYLCTHGIRIGQ